MNKEDKLNEWFPNKTLPVYFFGVSDEDEQFFFKVREGEKQ